MTDIPFNASYVVRETLRHWDGAVKISMTKTIKRMQGFEKGDQEKIKEAINALASLERLAKLVDDIKKQNEDILKDA